MPGIRNAGRRGSMITIAEYVVTAALLVGLPLLLIYELDLKHRRPPRRK